MRKSVVIVAGGSGRRFGGATPKQFLELDGTPIFIRTIKKFQQAVQDIQVVLVLPVAHFELAQSLLSDFDCGDIELVAGGEARFDSVKNGLAKVDHNGLIAVHDAVRPLVSDEVILNCFAQAEEHGAVIPVVKVESSLRSLSGRTSSAVNRDDYVIVQTPQVFKAEILKSAYTQQKKASFTDDASVVESTNISIYLVDGNKENIKITTPFDIQIANAFLKQSYDH